MMLGISLALTAPKQGGGTPAPPAGSQLLKGADGAYLKGADGAYLSGKAA